MWERYPPAVPEVRTTSFEREEDECEFKGPQGQWAIEPGGLDGREEEPLKQLRAKFASAMCCLAGVPASLRSFGFMNCHPFTDPLRAF